MKNIWNELPKPIFALAPMEAVTDTVFRQVINYCGRPDIYFTEFTNVDGLFSPGKKTVEQRLLFTHQEKPLIAQIWGMDLDKYERAATLIQEQGFDGIDINMGCPERKVVKRGSCAGLIHNPELAAKIIDAVKRGAPKIPVSVKTRIGIREIETEKWIGFLLSQNISTLTVHLRTVREMSKFPPHWDEMKKVIALRNKIAPQTLVLGNGDVMSRQQGLDLIDEYKMDGVMVGRGIFQDPFLFSKNKKLDDLSYEERMELLLYHSQLFQDTWGKTKNFEILRKFYKIYTHGLPNASALREKLMTTKNIDQVKQILND